jgi:hypothetical protein
MPTPPANAVVFTQIQTEPLTGVCDKSCAGDKTVGSDFFAQNVTSPSLSGRAMEIEAQGNYFDSMWYWHFGPYDTVRNFLVSFDIYVSDDSGAQAFEYGPQLYLGGYKYSMSAQCGYSTNLWRFWNQGKGKWTASNIPCTHWGLDQWHRLQIYTTANSAKHQYTFVAMDVDGIHIPVNLTFSATNLHWMDNLGLQFQIDENSSGSPVSEWVDNLTFWVW